MRLRTIALRVFLTLLVAVFAYFALSPTGRYLVRAAWEEGRILAHRHPIAALVADSATAPTVRAKLAPRARRACLCRRLARPRRQAELHHLLPPRARHARPRALRAPTATASNPSPGGSPSSAACRTRASSTSPPPAPRPSALDADGFDAYLRPSPAFSTLGFFNDPLLSTSLHDDSLDLANTVIHELTHNTFYAAGQAVFNESFANFAGARGSERFFRSRGDTATARRRGRSAGTTRKCSAGSGTACITPSIRPTGRIPESVAARIAAHDTVYARARQELVAEVGPQLRTIDTRYLDRARLDNATLLAQRIYLTDLDFFDDVYRFEDDDPRRAIAQVITIAKSRPDDPFGALRDWASAHPAPAAGSTPAPGPTPAPAKPAP